MKIWIVEIGEPLPLEAGARLLRYGAFSRELASRGHDVTWWTSTFSHAAKRQVRQGDTEEHVNGVRLVLLDGPGYRRNVSLARIRHQREFARRLATRIRDEEVPDIILCPIPTIDSAEVIRRYAAEHEVPVLLDIRDEWPDEWLNLVPAVARPLAQLALQREYDRLKLVCAAAAGIVGVSERQLEYGLTFAERPRRATDRVFYLGYRSTPVEERAVEAADAWWRERGLRPGARACAFVGTMAAHRPLGPIIEAARQLADRTDLQFVLCGDGDARKHFESMAGGLPNVLFPGWVDEAQIASLYRSSLLAFAPYLPDRSFSMPNKVFEILAAGLPLVTCGGGEMRGLVQSGCGTWYPHGSVEAVVSVVLQLADDPDLAQAMGRVARSIFQERFTFEATFDAMAYHMERIIEDRRIAAPCAIAASGLAPAPKEGAWRPIS